MDFCDVAEERSGAAVLVVVIGCLVRAGLEGTGGLRCPASRSDVGRFIVGMTKSGSAAVVRGCLDCATDLVVLVCLFRSLVYALVVMESSSECEAAEPSSQLTLPFP